MSNGPSDGNMVNLSSKTAEEHPLYEAIRCQLDSDAPILCHLNADTSWLILIPYPASIRPQDGRKFFKILIDPWFLGVQIDYFVWFSVQRHAIPASVATIAELEAILRRIERLEMSNSLHYSRQALGEDYIVDKSNESCQNAGKRIARRSPIDLVVICHEFSDHAHKETLTQLHPSTAIVANAAALKLIMSWGHFDNSKIACMPRFTSCKAPQPKLSKKRFSFLKRTTDSVSSCFDWRLAATNVSPDWLTISRLCTPKDAPQKDFHAGVLIAFRSLAIDSDSSEHEANGILYSPHGITAAGTAPLEAKNTNPIIRPVALLHGAVKMWLAGGMMPLNLGGQDGEQVARRLGVRYWFGTHEEEKIAGGGISYLLRRKRMEVPESGIKIPGAIHSSKSTSHCAAFRNLGSGEVISLT